MSNPQFFSHLRLLTVAEIASITRSVLRDESSSSLIIDNFSSLNCARSGSLVFLEEKKKFSLLQSVMMRPLIVFCSEELAQKIPEDIVVLINENPKRAFSTIVRHVFQDALLQPCAQEKGISAQAIIHEEAQIEEGVSIEAGAVIGKGVTIGQGSVICAGAVVGHGCQIGRHCYIGPCVSIQYSLLGNKVYIYPGARIGQDGFGYLFSEGRVEKVTQLGRVIIQDDVEIGANTTIDRGALEDTIIGEGSKIDNLVQIAHNVRVGRFCVIAAHTGIAGSVSIGDGTIIGGGAGVKDHVNIGAAVQIAAASGVMNDIPDGQKWGGAPARPIKQWLQEVSMLRKATQQEKWKRQND